MQKRCILCKQCVFSPFYSSLLRCQNCSLIVAKEAYEYVNAGALYNRDYFFGFEYRDYIAEEERFTRGFEARLKVIRKLKPSGKLLEIGCAYGFFLKAASRYFDTSGIDISEDATTYARQTLKASVVCADFLKHSFSKGSYDIVCMWDTIEHLKRPDLYLGKIAKLLRPGGLLCLTTGNIDQFVPRIQREKWRLIHPPTHLYYFSFKSLEKLLGNYGLTVISETYPGSWRSVLHILHGLGMKSPFFAKLEKKLRRFSFLRSLSLYYNVFDIMFIMARRKHKLLSKG